MTEASDSQDIAVLQQEAQEFRTRYEQIREEIGKAIVGQQRVVETVMAGMFSGGHVLLEGVPGLGKTELVKALSHILALEFKPSEAITRS